MSEAPVIEALLAERRLSAADDGVRRKFTVARTEAILRLRLRHRDEPWGFIASLGRAACVVAEDPVVVARRDDDGDHESMQLTFSVPGAPLEADLTGVVFAALEAEPIANASDPAPRFRHLLARGINEALATEPQRVEIVFPTAARQYHRGPVTTHKDPYREQSAKDRCPPGSFVIRVFRRRRGLGGRLGAWLTGRGDPLEVLTDMWRRYLVAFDPEDDARKGIRLRAPLPGTNVQLGSGGVWGPVSGFGGPTLVRDGVRLAALGPVLEKHGLPAKRFDGWIDWPRLRLTVDDDSVVHDAALDELVAWLFDADAHRYDDGEGPVQVQWPTELTAVAALSGRGVSFDEIRRKTRNGEDIPFVWPHLAPRVPPRLWARVLQLWPSERGLLNAAVPGAQLVPVHALGDEGAHRRVDLTSLRQGSFAPVEIEVPPGPGPDAAALSLGAYVHRWPGAERGTLVILAYERRVFQLETPDRTIPGVSLVCRIDTSAAGVDIDRLRNDRTQLGVIAQRCRDAAMARLSELVDVARGADNPWEIPLIRDRLRELTAPRLGLRFSAGPEGPRLSWEDHVLLGLAVGKNPTDEPRTARDALVRLRDVGGIVVGTRGRRWSTLEATDPDLEPWFLTPDGDELLRQLVGPEALWAMPVVPEALPRVLPGSKQLHLVVERDEIAALRKRMGADPKARSALLGHLLVARKAGRDEHGLERAALLVHYDPRALSPTHLLSLRAVTARGAAPRFVPRGAVGRSLPDPVLEVSPGEAVLLSEVLGLRPAGPADPRLRPASSGARTPTRRLGRERIPLASTPVVGAFAVGGLRLDPPAEATGIALWARGLRVGFLRLPAPLDGVGGRLWLTERGAGATADETLAEVRQHALGLAKAARLGRMLLPPGRPRRQQLDTFLARCRHAVADGSEPSLAVAIGAEPPRRLAPPPRRAGVSKIRVGGEARLVALIKHGLGGHPQIEWAWLSWEAAQLYPKRDPWVVELGSRNRFIKHARTDDAPPGRVVEAALLVVAQILGQARAQGWDLAPDEESEAMTRVLSAGL